MHYEAGKVSLILFILLEFPTNRLSQQVSEYILHNVYVRNMIIVIIHLYIL